MFGWLWKFLVFIWPFIRELVLGETTMKDAIKNNKFKVFLMGLIAASFLFNILLLERLITVSSNYVTLNKQYKALQQKPVAKTTVPVPARPANTDQPKPGASSPSTQAGVDQAKNNKPKVNAAQKHSEEEARYRKLQERLGQIKKTEDERP